MACLFGIALLAGNSTSAAAENRCQPGSFTPRTVVVGLSPRTPTFGACGATTWKLDSDAFSADSATPSEMFRPHRNSDAGPHDVLVTVDSAFEEREHVLINGFRLKRNSGWQRHSFQVRPHSLTSDGDITLLGRLLITDWERDRYEVAGDRTVKVQFRTPSGRYTTVASAPTDQAGWVRTRVRAEATGRWRLVYEGNTAAGRVVTPGQLVMTTR